jgi:hypothetical protein
MAFWLVYLIFMGCKKHPQSMLYEKRNILSINRTRR